MDVLKKYKHFVNEAVDSDKEMRSIQDVPGDVIETSKKIAGDMFDRVKKPTFEYVPGKGLIMSFFVTEQDFQYIDTSEPLKLEVSEGAKKKRIYDVTLNYLDRTSETFEVKYLVTFEMPVEELSDEDMYDEDDDDNIDEYEEDTEVDAVYQRLMGDWRKKQSREGKNTNPGEGTRKKLLKLAKEELGKEDEDWEDEKKAKVEDIDEFPNFYDEDE
jgi:hypothetical protein